MTDADVDGAHIRTLLLTFFFRQMPQLFEKEMVYIAQPPLYEIKQKGSRKSEYILNESQMRKRMQARGMDSAVINIRANGSPPITLSGDELTTLVKLLNEAERIARVLERRGIIFRAFIANYYDGSKLPCFYIRTGDQEEFFYNQDQYDKRREELGGADSHDSESADPSVTAKELHEVVKLNKIDAELKERYSLDMRDFLHRQQRSVSGQPLPTKFEIVSGSDDYQVASLGGICQAIRLMGGKGIDIKRFKGLGEMNSDQLWETTMDPSRRTLLQVTVENAGEADRLFSVLMGDDVEKRRNFIKEHALEVQNLDV